MRLLKVTQAGINALNASVDNSLQMEITSLQLGSGIWNAPLESSLSSAVALKNVKQIATFGKMSRTSDGTYRVATKLVGNSTYLVYEVGFFTSTGVLFAVLADDTDPISSVASGLKSIFTYSLKFNNLDTNSLTVVHDNSIDFDVSSETALGIIEIVDNTEFGLGTDNSKAVTASKLSNIDPTSALSENMRNGLDINSDLTRTLISSALSLDLQAQLHNKTIDDLNLILAGN